MGKWLKMVSCHSGPRVRSRPKSTKWDIAATFSQEKLVVRKASNQPPRENVYCKDRSRWIWYKYLYFIYLFIIIIFLQNDNKLVEFRRKLPTHFNCLELILEATLIFHCGNANVDGGCGKMCSYSCLLLKGKWDIHFCRFQFIKKYSLQS